MAISKTWYEAQSYCRQYHTDLATARDATDNSIIQGKITVPAWFGLFRDTWKWSDHTNVSTITWMSGQPDNALENENCASINNGQVADSQCADVMPFFCYSGEIKFYLLLNIFCI